MELEYLIIYTNTGIPIYARCFSDICKTSIGNPTLFSAFLASLNQFAKLDPEHIPEELELNGYPLKVNFNNEEGVNHVLLEDLELMFFYADMDDITIAAGYNASKYDRNDTIPVFLDFMKDVEVFLKDYKDNNWNDVDTNILMMFETELLKNIIHPFFEVHDIKDTCALGVNCPFRIAIYEEQGSIFDRLRAKVVEYRSMNLLKKVYNLVLKKKYVLNLN